MPNTREKLIISQKIQHGKESICPKCFHGNICKARDFQPCFECNQFVDANGVTFAEDINVPSKWISVKEHLPQDDLPFGALCEIVQVLLDDGTVTVGWCNRGLKCWYYMPIQATNFVGHDYDKTPVIAWQPLAQPPADQHKHIPNGDCT